MMRSVLSSHKFFDGLVEVDRAIAAQVREEGCSHCGGPLHVANYPRKPRGVPSGVGDRWRSRFSFCCGAEGCRRRRTPPSVRFSGRRIFVAVWLLFAGLLATSERPSSSWGWVSLRRRLAVSRRTWCRWLSWWRCEFPETEVGRGLRARQVGRGTPLAVYCHLSGAPPGRMITLLSLIEAGSLRGWNPSRSPRGV